MRIALVTENFLPKLDGVTRTLALLLEHLRRTGHRVIVLGPAGAPRRYAGAPVFHAPGVPLPFYPELRFLFPRPSLARRLARFQPDLVHVVDPMALGAAGIHWARRLGAPVIASYHTNLAAYSAYYHLGPLVAPLWRYRRALHNRCAVTLCPSPSTAAELRHQGFERVEIWPRGVDSALFTPAQRSPAWRQHVTGDANAPIILYVGRLAQEKNLHDLVTAFRALEETGAWLVLVGDGPARAELAQALEGRRAVFTGYLRGAELAQAYASADVFAFPSLTETFGQAVMEAMASGLPVVGYDAEGVRDSVRHDETGLLAPARDTVRFTAYLRSLLASPAWRLQLGRRARLHAERHSWDAVMAQLSDVYTEMYEQAVTGAGGELSPAASSLASRLTPGMREADPTAVA